MENKLTEYQEYRLKTERLYLRKLLRRAVQIAIERCEDFYYDMHRKYNGKKYPIYINECIEEVIKEAQAELREEK